MEDSKYTGWERGQKVNIIPRCIYTKGLAEQIFPEGEKTLEVIQILKNGFWNNFKNSEFSLGIFRNPNVLLRLFRYVNMRLKN